LVNFITKIKNIFSKQKWKVETICFNFSFYIF
jgi:hypothetical protein